VIRKSYYRSGRNETFTSQQYALGQKLAEILASVGNDLLAAEAMVAKAGFSQDRIGTWFAKIGDHKATLEDGQVVTVADIVKVPTPEVLQPPQLGRSLVPADKLWQ